jgi:tight adherence protein C
MLFLGIRTLLSFGPALAVLVPRVSTGQPLGGTLFTAILVWGIGHTLVNLIVRMRATRRIRLLTNALPDTLDLMTTCLEAGLGLNATIARVGEERASMDDPLGQEFALVSFELRSGRTREDALRGLGDRNGVEDLKALAGLIIQSDRLGASMAQTLRAHADLLRTKRRQRAEEAARKLPIKMLFPLALFILPALFVVIGGPAILRIQDLVQILLG